MHDRGSGDEEQNGSSVEFGLSRAPHEIVGDPQVFFFLLNFSGIKIAPFVFEICIQCGR